MGDGDEEVESLWYPTVEDVVDIHDDIVNEYPDTEPGIRNRGTVAFALEFVRRGSFDERPASIHQKAYHLMRLLTANHPFVDGNKRTALDAVATFYTLNGYEFEYDHGIRSILKTFATDASTVDEDDVIAYLESRTTRTDLRQTIEPWREELLEWGLERLDEQREEDDTAEE